MNFKDLEATYQIEAFLQLLRKLMELKLLVFITFLKSILTSVKLNLLMLSPDVSHKKYTIEEIESELNQIDTMSDYSFFGD